MVRNHRPSWGYSFYTGLIYFFLYVPILMLIIYSFNTSRLNAVWEGFTLDWYRKLFQDTAILKAAGNTLFVAVVSTIFSTILGTITALAMVRDRFPGKTIMDGILYIPVIIPEIVMGISLLAFFALVKVPLGIWTMIIAHITFSVSFVVVTVRTRLDGFDRSLEEAAQDLGADEWKTFRLVTLPLIMPGILAGAMLAFTLSIDDFIVSYFVAGPGSTTLPLKIYSMVKFGVTPEINALSTVLLLLTLGLIIGQELLQHRSPAKVSPPTTGGRSKNPQH